MNGLLTPTPVRICDVYPDGDDSLHFTFEPLDDSTAGNGSPTSPSPGQFFLLTVPGFGEAAFTYASLPDEQGRFDALIRRMGTLTSALFGMKPGALLGARGPFGRGWPLDSLCGGRVLVVAGGCGLAPLATALEVLADMADTSAVLLYGSRTETGRNLAREREAWTLRLPVIEIFDNPVESDNAKGTVLDGLDDAFAALGASPSATLLCGPEVMMTAAARALELRGIAASDIWLSLERRMHCGVGLCGHCYVGSTYACTHGPTYSWQDLRRHGTPATTHRPR